MDRRARRAVPLLAAALTALVVASVLFLRSELRPPAAGATPSPTPIPRLVGTYTPTFDFLDEAHGWAVVLDWHGPEQRFWIFATTDGAVHWRRLFTGDGGGGRTYIHFFDLRHGFAYAGKLYRTTDAGATWLAVQTPSDGPYFTFATATRGWFMPAVGAVPPHLYTTADGGVTWSAVPAPPPPGTSAELAFRADGEGWLGAGLESPRVYLTKDGGLSWRAIALPAPEAGFSIYITSVRLLPGHAVLALVGSPAGFLGGYWSDDLGANWVQINPLPQPEWLADASFVDDYRWWVARYGFLYKTSTAGVDWERVPVQPLPGGWNIQPVHVIDANHGWWTMIETTDSRDSALMMTSDGGANWRAVAMPTPG
ncbi:MAG TPA: hypothetical protein VJR46_11480 [Candidatus Dormibacteraeota bacterium]|nr:hypothetical protein [Candidatus Dormibacteraeota bacterium]